MNESRLYSPNEPGNGQECGKTRAGKTDDRYLLFFCVSSHGEKERKKVLKRGGPQHRKRTWEGKKGLLSRPNESNSEFDRKPLTRNEKNEWTEWGKKSFAIESHQWANEWVSERWIASVSRIPCLISRPTTSNPDHARKKPFPIKEVAGFPEEL